MVRNEKALKYFKLISFLVIFALLPIYSNAATLYKDCIMGSDFGDNIPESLGISPAGMLCQQNCDRECARLSRKQGVSELNADIIEICKIKCRAGERYSTTSLRIPSGSSYVVDNKEYKIDVACAQNDTSKLGLYYPHETQIVLNVDDEALIKLRGLDSMLSMCGTRVYDINPNFRSYTASDWELPQNKPKWQNLTNSKSHWNARNAKITNTGIFIKDGDFLSINYSGKYRFWQCNTHIDDCLDRPEGRNILIKKPNVPFNASFNMDNFEVLPGEKLYTYNRSPSKQLSGVDRAVAYNQLVEWKGLRAKLDMSYEDTVDGSGNEIVDTVGTPSVQFYGLLKDFSQKYTKLGMQHYDANVSYWVDNLGGFDLRVVSKGCIFSKGERLQYAIGKEKPNNVATTPVSDRYDLPELTAWKDVPQDVMLNYTPLKATEAGKLYLRIKPLQWQDDTDLMPICANDDSTCNNDLSILQSRYAPGEADGMYFVQVEKIAAAGLASNVLSDTVRDVRKYFFGEKGQGGMVQTLFNRLVSNSNLVSAIRALILLYITWTGLSFVIGVSQITQREGVMRIFYLGLVVTLLSPNSWQFFNTYIFQLFINGGIQLMSYAMNPTDVGLPQNVIFQIQQDPALIFSILDKPLTILFGKKTWIKIYALILTSSLGILVGLAVLFAGIVYGVTIIKAMMIYVVSLIFMAILLLLAPIFISFSLFKYTREMFKKWLEQLASAMFQPVFIVLGLGIFSNLLLVGLYSALSVTVCAGCLFSFYIPIPLIMSEPVCLWPAYFTMYGLHSPPGASFSPVATISAVFYFLIVAQGAYVYCSKISEIINSMIAGFFQGVNLGGYSNIGEYTTDYLSQVRSAWGYARLEGTRDSQGRLVGTRAGIKSFMEGSKSLEVDPKKRSYGGGILGGTVSTIGGFAKGVGAGFQSSYGGSGAAPAPNTPVPAPAPNPAAPGAGGGANPPAPPPIPGAAPGPVAGGPAPAAGGGAAPAAGGGANPGGGGNAPRGGGV